MFQLKLLGACLIAIAGWYGGIAACSAATAHRVALAQTITLLKLLEEEISFRHANLNDVYRTICAQHGFSSLQFAVVDAQPVAAFQSLCPPNGFSKEEKTAFIDCFSRLGYANAAQECQRLARYRKQFEAFFETASQREARSLAIDRKIGFALGSMVALILL